MYSFETLPAPDRELLLQFPAYISLLAFNLDGKMDEVEKENAVEFAHVKTFSCDPRLREFYREADEVFESTITRIDKELPAGKDAREIAIREALTRIEGILSTIDPGFAAAMHLSMRLFKDHVSRAHNSVLESFLFPVPVKGLTY